MLSLSTKTKQIISKGSKVAFISGLLNPLVVEVITNIQKIIDGDKTKAFFFGNPSLYIIIALITYLLMIIPCVLGSYFQFFVIYKNIEFKSSITTSVISSVISLASFPLVWRLYQSGSSPTELIIFLIFTYLLHIILFFFFKK